MPKSLPEKTLTERILALKSECEAWLDERAALVKDRDCRGIPLAVIKNILMARSNNPFDAVLRAMEQDV